MAYRIRKSSLFILLITTLFSISSHSAPYYGANFYYVAASSEPPTLQGYQLMLSYDPERFQWRNFNVYFDAGFSHLWITSTPYYSTLNIYSAAPIVRYTFKKRGPIRPYLDLSIGVAYLNHTRLDSRNFGEHFAFQDRIGIGVFLGAKEQFSVGVHAIHYSNAHLSSHNSGITMSAVLDVGYRFQ